MSETRYDFVVFGATGFTGQFVVDEVARVIEENGGAMKMAVAGRSMEKLQKILKESSQRTGKDLEETPIIICDVSSEESLAEMCKQAKVVLNCVGPYRFYGEQVVKACIENGAHHIDISGEPQYLERMQLLYSGKARENDVYVVGACGFDSIPSDMGVAFLTEKFKGDLNSVEFYITLHPGEEGLSGNITTLESALHGLAHSNELKPLRKTLFPTPLPRSQYKLQPKALGFNDDVNKWCMNFPGSDRAIVNRSVRFNYEVNQQRPFQVGAYIQLPSFLYVMITVIFGMIIGLMAKFSFGRSLILKMYSFDKNANFPPYVEKLPASCGRYPQVFTFGVFKKGGPSKKQIETSSFSITLIGKGWKDKLTDVDAQHDTPPDSKITVKVSGPEAGYVTTPICMVQCALTLLKEVTKEKLSGGVYTSASIFRDTSLIDRLTKHNVKYEVTAEQGPL